MTACSSVVISITGRPSPSSPRPPTGGAPTCGAAQLRTATVGGGRNPSALMGLESNGFASVGTTVSWASQYMVVLPGFSLAVLFGHDGFESGVRWLLGGPLGGQALDVGQHVADRAAREGLRPDLAE